MRFYKSSYVGETNRKLSTRICEHISDINKKMSFPSVIFNHCINFNYNFRWNKVKILDSDSFYNKKLISEMVYIKKQKQGLNKQNDTELLPESYLQIIQALSPS